MVSKHTCKALENKNAINNNCISNTPTFYLLRMNFCGQIFSRVYHPQDIRLQKKIWPQKFIRKTWNFAVFEMQIRELKFYLPMPYVHTTLLHSMMYTWQPSTQTLKLTDNLQTNTYNYSSLLSLLRVWPPQGQKKTFSWIQPPSYGTQREFVISP